MNISEKTEENQPRDEMGSTEASRSRGSTPTRHLRGDTKGLLPGPPWVGGGGAGARTPALPGVTKWDTDKPQPKPWDTCL